MSEITPQLLADILAETALMLELKGEKPSKIGPYRKAAAAVKTFEGDIVGRARDSEFKGIKGIDESLHGEVNQLAVTGRLEIHDQLRSDFSQDLLNMLKLKGLGPKEAKVLYRELGIDSLAALKRACQSGQVESLAGFGKESVEKILDALDQRERWSGRFRRAEVAPVVERLVKHLRRHPDVVRAEVAGTYRRGRETLDDLSFLVATRKPTVLTEYFTELEEIHQVILQGSSKAAVRLENGMKCDLRAVAPVEWPFALLYFTGSKEHYARLRARALEQGFTLNEYHLAPVNGETWNDSTAKLEEEADIYRELGLSYIEPESRENRGEIEAAVTGEEGQDHESSSSKAPVGEAPSTITR